MYIGDKIMTSEIDLPNLCELKTKFKRIIVYSNF